MRWEHFKKIFPNKLDLNYYLTKKILFYTILDKKHKRKYYGTE